MKSVRELARALGLSHSTVYDALRNSPKVKKATRERVLEAAEKEGLRHNPLAGALMSEIRRSSTASFQGVVAVVDLECAEKRITQAAAFINEMYEGAKEMAAELGFRTEPFVLGDEEISVERLGSILSSRGINGLLILPARESPDISALDWDRYAGVYCDSVIEKPALDSVSVDHYRSMLFAMSKIREYGYKRPGFVMEGDQDQRLLYRYEAGYRMAQREVEGFEIIEPYISQELSERGFQEWFERNQPDIVICHRMITKQWMESMGLKVPETHGFCKINVSTTQESVSGLDLCPRALGKRGMGLLVGKLHRNAYGIPAKQMTSTIAVEWVDGATMRQM
ncbi:LacI family DNA-binding transcriptional regulator [Pelagicoccus mobilis]|uniref:LacI family DNA-binding transcriptional regulator n=1 Tax=Pelagicoccus mobilis TaxID=415221 RepID=A0A934RSB6_9BACT|nr:LacI family DNA-binding transcriptional regulator [Pelagicoccus mobilis]MBK1875456.1 LacI family DNA-binding transcriptional regulator [Pelagicoccus mobilis]